MKVFSSENDSRVVAQTLRYLNVGAPLCIGIYMFLNAFPHMTALKEISFYGSVFITLILISFRYFTLSLRNPLSFFILMYACWSVLSIFWSIDRGNSFHDVYAHLVKHIILYFLLVSFFFSRKRLVILMWVVVVSTTICSFSGIIYFYIVLGKPFSERLLSLPNAPGTPLNTIAIISLVAALMSLFFLLKDRHIHKRVVMLVCYIVTFSATLLTYSRGGIVGLTVASVVMLFFLYREKMGKLLAVIVVLFILTGSFAMGSPTFRHRFNPSVLLNNLRPQIWHTSIEMIKDRPLTGFGFGMEAFKKTLWNQYSTKVPVKWSTDKPFEHPHNFILDVTVRLGVIGLISIALILFFSFKMSFSALRSKKRFIRNYGACLTATLLGVLIAGLFGKIVSGQSAVIFFTILAMITILWQLNLEEEQATRSESEHFGEKLSVNGVKEIPLFYQY